MRIVAGVVLLTIVLFFLALVFGVGG